MQKLEKTAQGGDHLQELLWEFLSMNLPELKHYCQYRWQMAQGLVRPLTILSTALQQFL